MNDVSKNIRAFIYTTIDGNITFDSSNVPCYTKVPPDVRPPYITVRTGSMAPDHTKDTFGGIYQVIIEVVTRFKRNIGGQDDCDDISDSVMELLSPLGTYTSDFGQDTMWMFTGPEIRVIEETDDEYHYYIKELVFEAHVEQNDGHNINIDEILDRAPEPFAPGERANLYKVFNRMAESGNWDQLDMILILSLTSPANALWNWKTPSEFLLKPGKYYEVPSSVMTLLQASSDLDITFEMKVLSTASNLFQVAQENPDTGIGTLLYVRNSDSDTDKITEMTYTSLTIGDLPVLSGITTLDDGYQALVTGEWVTVTFIGITSFAQLSTLFFNNHPNGVSNSGTFYLRNLKFATEGDQNYNIRYDGYGRSLTGHDDLITTGLQPVAVNSPTHTPGKGYEGNGTNSVINTNYIPNTDNVNLSINDTVLSGYVYSNDDFGVNYLFGAYGTSSNYLGLFQYSLVPGNWAYLNSSGLVIDSEYPLQERSSYEIVRDGATSISIYKNGTQIATDTHATTSLPDVPIGLFCRISAADGGGRANFMNAYMSYFLVGGGLDLTALATEKALLESLFIQSIQDQVINIFPNALSTTEEANVRSLVTQMIASGTWFNLENLWVLSMEDATNALYCWKTGTLATAVNGPSHTANQGYLFDGSTNYINTNVTPSDDFRVASLDDIRIEAFVYENLDTDNDGARLFGGSIPAGSTFEFQQNPDTPRIQANVFSASSDKTKYDNQSYFEDNTRYGIGRDDATNQEIFINGVQVDSEADGSDSLSTVDVFIGARNYSAAVNHINARISYLSISNAQDPTSLATDLDTLESLFITYVAPSYSTEAQAVIDRMPNPMSTNEKNKIATVVDQMVNNGTWAETDYFFMFAMSDATNALTDWKTGLTATAVNGPTHTAGEGYAFDGSTNYLRTGVVPSDLTQAGLNDIELHIYLNSYTTPVSTYDTAIGIVDSVNGAYLIIYEQAPGYPGFGINRGGLDLETGGPSLSDTGRFGIKRNASNSEEFLISGVTTETNSESSNALSPIEIYAGARNTNGSVNQHAECSIAHFWIGSAQASNLSTDLTLAETTFIS